MSDFKPSKAAIDEWGRDAAAFQDWYARFGRRFFSPVVVLDDHAALTSVGLVCICGKAVASIEGVARTCECGRIWVITATQLGVPRA